MMVAMRKAADALVEEGPLAIKVVNWEKRRSKLVAAWCDDDEGDRSDASM